MSPSLHPQTKTLDLDGQQLLFETGRYAEQASANVTVRAGDTLVMATITKGGVREGIDFFALRVDYEEKLYASGIIKSSRFLKREGRPTDEAILKARLIDRAIRPLFPKGYRNEVQVVVTILAFDGENSPEIIGALAAYAAIHISDLPWDGPLGCVRLAHTGESDGESGFLVNPTVSQQAKSGFDLIASGTGDRILMLEAGFAESPDELVMKGMEKSLDALGRICSFMDELRKDWGAAKSTAEEEAESTDLQDRFGSQIREHITAFMDKFGSGEVTRHDFGSMVTDRVLPGADDGEADTVKELIDFLYKKAVRERILKEGRRPDGRRLDEIRSIDIDVGLIPRVHGSAMFKRGETQVLNVVTLGPPSLEQLSEGLDGLQKKRFLHHYIAPPYSVGEVGRIGAPGRREIGHGMLAEKALRPVVPSQEEFAYTIRLVSEVMSQNGSTSMASTCASSLSLMDAGVKIKRPVAGIAMGLMTDETSGDFKILTDLAGVEDFGGDMDFKVTGSREGITAIQMDTKIHGITMEMTRQALEGARAARLFLLDEMDKALPLARPSLSPLAPKVDSIKVPQDAIGKVIGSGGSTIRKISEDFGVQVDIEEDGTVTIAAVNQDDIDRAKKLIKGMTSSPDVGEIYDATVVRTLEFGAFVEIFPGTEGLVHISRMSKERVNRVEDVVSTGDKVKVKLLEIDQLGRLNLSMNLDDTPGSTRPNTGGGRPEGRSDRRPDRDRRPPYDRRPPRDRNEGGRDSHRENRDR